MVTSTATSVAPRQNLVIENEIPLHLEDACTVNAIRNGKLVAVRWNDLTDSEKRTANLVTFHLCDWEVSA